MLVLDTNVLAYFFLKTDPEKFDEKALLKDSDWITPPLAVTEFSNVLLLYVRQNLIDKNEALHLFKLLLKSVKFRKRSVSPNDILNLALTCSLSIYDTEFVALAQAHHCQLLTHDKKIIKEFPDLALTPAQFLNTN